MAIEFKSFQDDSSETIKKFNHPIITDINLVPKWMITNEYLIRGYRLNFNKK